MLERLMYECCSFIVVDGVSWQGVGLGVLLLWWQDVQVGVVLVQGLMVMGMFVWLLIIFDSVV